MKFFFDNCISPNLARGISVLIEPDGHEVTPLRDFFSADTKDPIWIKTLGEEGGWIIVSGDHRILKNAHNLEAWKNARLPIFVFARGFTGLKFWEQVQIAVFWWPTVLKFAGRIKPTDAYQTLFVAVESLI